MIHDGRLDVSVVFDKYQARWLREQPPIHSEEEREDLPDGGLRLSFSVGLNDLEVAARFCLSFSGHCRIERPEALRKFVCKCLQQALIQHQE
jgi:hypothetical protein